MLRFPVMQQNRVSIWNCRVLGTLCINRVATITLLNIWENIWQRLCLEANADIVGKPWRTWRRTWVFLAQHTRELRSGIPLCSCSDILIYKPRLHLLSTEKIDLFVHLSQSMSDLKVIMIVGLIGRQLHFCSLLLGSLSLFYLPTLNPWGCSCQKDAEDRDQENNLWIGIRTPSTHTPVNTSKTGPLP